MSWILRGLEIIPSKILRTRTISEFPRERLQKKALVNARRAKWRAKNPDRAKAQWTAWNRKPEVVARKKIWMAVHRDHLNKMARDRRARARELRA